MGADGLTEAVLLMEQNKALLKRGDEEKARADAAERERDEAKSREGDMFYEANRRMVECNDLRATIATLREEVEKAAGLLRVSLGHRTHIAGTRIIAADVAEAALALLVALSPPQASTTTQACKCERRAKGWRHNHGNCPKHPVPAGQFPSHNGPGGPVWVEQDDEPTTTQGAPTGKWHRCMRCGVAFDCLTPGCMAGDNVLPRRVTADGQVVEHECAPPTPVTHDDDDWRFSR